MTVNEDKRTKYDVVAKNRWGVGAALGRCAKVGMRDCVLVVVCSINGPALNI